MISKKTKYALKALTLLAEAYESRKPVLISELADKEKMPKKFLEQILLELNRKGILMSKKGKGGGYLLSKAPDQISVGSVIRILEGPLAPVPCVSQTAYQRCDECQDEVTCGIRWIMKEVRDATANILDQTTLREMLDRKQSPEMMFHI